MNAVLNCRDENLLNFDFEITIDVSFDSNKGVFRRYHVGNKPVNFKDPKGLTLPGYNYCGPGSNPDKAPTNDLDTCCMRHDNCYAGGGAAWNKRNVSCTPGCDKDLCNCMKGVDSNLPFFGLIYITFRCWQLY